MNLSGRAVQEAAQFFKIAPADIAHVREASKVWGDMMRNPQAFGPEVDAPADASDQDKLLAYLGRQP